MATLAPALPGPLARLASLFVRRNLPKAPAAFEDPGECQARLDAVLDILTRNPAAFSSQSDLEALLRFQGGRY